MTDNKGTLSNSNTWVRLAYMFLFTLLLMAARLVITLVVIVQFLLVLVTGSDNENLRNLGQGLGKWVYQTIMFLTFNTESKSFPFDEWPEVDPSQGYSVRTAEDIEEAEFVEVEDDDVPSFTADEAPVEDEAPAADKAPSANKKTEDTKKHKKEKQIASLNEAAANAPWRCRARDSRQASPALGLWSQAGNQAGAGPPARRQQAAAAGMQSIHQGSSNRDTVCSENKY